MTNFKTFYYFHRSNCENMQKCMRSVSKLLNIKIMYFSKNTAYPLFNLHTNFIKIFFNFYESNNKINHIYLQIRCTDNPGH